MQLHAFKTLPYIYQKPALNRHLEKLVRNRGLIPEQPPFWKHAAKWQCGIVDGWKRDGEKSMTTQKYGPLKRVIRRWAETKNLCGTRRAPSLPVQELDFQKAM
jgi:hypothetical protein